MKALRNLKDLRQELRGVLFQRIEVSLRAATDCYSRLTALVPLSALQWGTDGQASKPSGAVAQLVRAADS